MPAPIVQGFFYNEPDYYPPIVNATRLLCAAGYEVELFCREAGGPRGVQYPEQARIVRVDGRSRGSWAEFLGFLRRSLWQARPDAGCFWGHDMHGFLAARLAAWRHRRPLVYHCHDYAQAQLMTRGSQLVHAFERRFARTANTVVMPDADRAGIMARDLQLAHSPVIAANAPLLRPLVRRGALRAALVEDGHRFSRIVFRQGRIGPGHGLEVTLRSLPMWQGQDWGFVIIGISDANYVASLHRLAAALGVAQRFVVLPAVPYDRILDYTADADVGHALYERFHVNNVHIGTSSNKVMEYLASGVPVLAPVDRKLQALVESAQCGTVADETKPADIARAINDLLGDPERHARMGRAARQAFEREYCYDRQFAPVVERMRALTISQPRAS